MDALSSISEEKTTKIQDSKMWEFSSGLLSCWRVRVAYCKKQIINIKKRCFTWFGLTMVPVSSVVQSAIDYAQNEISKRAEWSEIKG